MEKGFIDPGTHEFILVALASQQDKIAKLERQVRRIKSGRFLATLCFAVGLCYMYTNLTSKIDDCMNKKDIPEQTK